MASAAQATTGDVVFDKQATGTTSNDPFAAQRNADTNANANAHEKSTENPVAATEDKSLEPVETSQGDEWDASKTPPSRFQQRKGSLFATPGSRDGHVARNTDRDAAYHAKLSERGWGSGGSAKDKEREKDRRGSKVSN